MRGKEIGEKGNPEEDSEKEVNSNCRVGQA
jgi:hypothetical protein